MRSTRRRAPRRSASAFVIFLPAYSAIFVRLRNGTVAKQPRPWIGEGAMVSPGASFRGIVHVLSPRPVVALHRNGRRRDGTRERAPDRRAATPWAQKKRRGAPLRAGCLPYGTR